MNASELKYHVENTGSYFFTKETMRFFGDTMRNYGVRKTIVQYDGQSKEVYELYRRHPVKFGNQESAYFDTITFERIHLPIEIK